MKRIVVTVSLLSTLGGLSACERQNSPAASSEERPSSKPKQPDSVASARPPSTKTEATPEELAASLPVEEDYLSRVYATITESTNLGAELERIERELGSAPADP